MRRSSAFRPFVLLLLLGPIGSLYALDPHKALTQYSRSSWTQQQGLPQDTVSAIAQTTDGFLWIGTDEGVARFDGYEFTTFTKDNTALPSNTINALAAGQDGSLWIATPKGLARYKDGRFSTYGRREGLEDESIAALWLEVDGTVWMVANGSLSRLQNGHIDNFKAGRDVPMQAIRSVTGDAGHHIYAAGWTGVARFEDGRFVPVAGREVFGENLPQGMIVDRQNGFWVVGTRGLLHRAADGSTTTYRSREGLFDAFGTNVVLQDRDGNIWAGTDNGLARLENGRFHMRTEPGGEARLSVHALFEDSEGDLWIGSNAGLIRLRDEAFTVYGKPEGLISDEPDAIFQDHLGRIWAGFADGGMMCTGCEPLPAQVRAGLPKGRVFSIRETHGGELLVAARDGLVRIKDNGVRTFVPPDPLNRKTVYDMLEGSDGRLWLALPNGVAELRGTEARLVIESGTSRDTYPCTFAQSHDGSLWVGTEGKGLWHITGPEGQEKVQLYTTADGLGSDSIRSVSEDRNGTLWIGTIGGGLNAFRNGKFLRFTAKDGLPSDNIAKLIDAGDTLWISTSRGIASIAKQQLEDFAANRIPRLQTLTFGIADGLRSAESPMLGSGGFLNRDGSIWFATNRGIAAYQPQAPRHPELSPSAHILDIQAGGHTIGLAGKAQIEPSWGSPQIRYTAIHLSAPYRVQYSYKLEGLDTDWVAAGARRVVNYSGLGHGDYVFQVRAEIPGGPGATDAVAFSVLPRYYETAWFRLFCAAMAASIVWAIYRLRVRQVSARFQTVLDERARLAREVHDTLAQGFVGISSQLAVVESYMPAEDSPGRDSLQVARRMAQHSLTEARRSVADLRAAALDEQDLGGALKAGAQQWAAGSGVAVDVDVTGDAGSLPEDVAHHVLRIAQEGVSNVIKHAHARSVELSLLVEAERLNLRIADNGCGFEPEGMLVSSHGNFGLMGMRERAERLGGEFNLHSIPGRGTELKVTVPLK